MGPWDVAVVGGGPVGLMLGCRLAQLGMAFVVFDRELRRGSDSRAIGIHPPGLVRLQALGLMPRLVSEGVIIERAQARAEGERLGSLDLTTRPGPIGFSLSLPQPVTEGLLEDKLERRAPGALRRGHVVTGVDLAQERAELTVRRPDGRAETHRARWLIGCDGRHSLVRRAMGVTMKGSDRPESYLTADVADDTPFGAEPVVFLADEGLVESFPLPEGWRRWVAEAPSERREADVEELADLVEARCGHRIRPETARAVSAFGIEQRLAERLRAGPALLAGDAAHVISPIGAQGMNLGWIGAWRLAGALAAVCEGRARPERVFADYARRQRAQARQAMRRATLNGIIGRKSRHPRLRNEAVRRAMSWVPDRILASLFTMAPLWELPVGRRAGWDEPLRVV